MEKAEDQKPDDFQDKRSEPGSLQLEEMGKHSQLVETRSKRCSVVSTTSSARPVLCWKVKALKGQEELQARLAKLEREAKQLEQEAKETEIADLHEQLARKARIAEKEREIAKASSSQGTSVGSISPGDIFTEDSGWMDKSETAENGAEFKIVVHSKSENAVKLNHKGKYSAPMRDWKDRTKADNGACRQGATSQPEVRVANKGTSKLLTAECIQNWSETFVVDNGRQYFCSDTLLVDTKQVLKEEIHLFMSELSIMQTENF